MPTIHHYQFSSSLTQVGKKLGNPFMLSSISITSKPLGLLTNIDITHIAYRPMKDDLNKNYTLVPNPDAWQVWVLRMILFMNQLTCCMFIQSEFEKNNKFLHKVSQ